MLFFHNGLKNESNIDHTREKLGIEFNKYICEELHSYDNTSHFHKNSWNQVDYLDH